jgi:hypothetical protein
MPHKPGKRIAKMGRAEPFSASLFQSEHGWVVKIAHSWILPIDRMNISLGCHAIIAAEIGALTDCGQTIHGFGNDGENARESSSGT